MNAFSLLAASLKKNDPEYPALLNDVEDGICCMTGLFCKTTARKNAIKASFTRLDLLQAPNSNRVSIDVYLAMNYKWERMSSWFCDGDDFKRLDRIGVRKQVFSHHAGKHWIGYATTSYKKHGVLLTPINAFNSNTWAFENEIVYLDGNWLEWWEILNKALREGIGRSVLETLDCPNIVMRKAGLTTWMHFEAWARPKYLTAKYRFLCYLLPSQEELKAE